MKTRILFYTAEGFILLLKIVAIGGIVWGVVEAIKSI